MKTINELKKCPQLAIGDLIEMEVINERKLREVDLNIGYLKRHPDVKTVPDYIQEDSERLALHYVIGGLQTLLKIAIRELQEAEAEIEALKQAEFHR